MKVGSVWEKYCRISVRDTTHFHQFCGVAKILKRQNVEIQDVKKNHERKCQYPRGKEEIQWGQYPRGKDKIQWGYSLGIDMNRCHGSRGVREGGSGGGVGL